jgi:putative photosynthetic complex assembly protein
MTVHVFPDRPSATPHDHGHDHDQIHVPKPVMIMMIALIVFSITAVAVSRVWQIGVTHEDTLHPVRSARFTVTGSNGGALIVRRADGMTVQLAKAGEEIFPRLILRSVGNIRQRDGVSLSSPLQIDLMPDNQRLLVDPATHRVLRLDAFGPENAQMLDALLTPGKPA